MRIMDVQQFISTQYKDNERRRVSQYTRFIDKHVDFVTYFGINRVLSTTSIGNMAVDSYIGKDSPVRYNRINNFPIYGFPLFNEENSYDEDNAGLNMDGFSGEIIMLPEILEPSEGDCFIFDMYDPNRFFIVTEVRTVVLKGKSHYALSFTAGIPDYLPQLKSQVVDEYNAIFDNIGTEDRVVISSKDYQLKSMYEDTYKQLYSYYIHKFFDNRTTMFRLSTELNKGYYVDFTDIYCTKFMKDNRIVVLDKLLKQSLVMDYNNLYTNDDYFRYMDTLYWAIERKDPSRIKRSDCIIVKELNSPFTLHNAQYKNTIYITKQYFGDNIETSTPPSSIPFGFRNIVDRIFHDQFFISDDPVDSLISLIVRYLNDDKVIEPGYFTSVEYEKMSEIEQYMLLPIMLFILRYNIYGLTRLNNVL